MLKATVSNLKYSVIFAALLVQPAAAITLKEAVRRAATEHPSVGVAVANRNAIGYQLLQSQGRFLPTIELGGELGAQIVDKPGSPPPANDEWLNRRQVSVGARQFIFDGFDRINDIYSKAARVDAATLRILRSSQLNALKAVEAYIDVRRHNIVLDLAKQNVARHREILGTVRSLVSGGKAPRSDIAQAEQRLAAAQAAQIQVERLLEDTKIKFREAVGAEAERIGRVGLAKGLPGTANQAVSVARRHNSLLLAAKVDVDATKYNMEQGRSAFFPRVELQANATYGEDIDGIYGRNNDVTGKVVMSYNIFDGRVRDNRVQELQQRIAEAESNYMLISRQVKEAVERAYAGYNIGAKRVAALKQEVNANERVVAAYTEEYKLSKRSLLDLLDAENALFGSRFQWNSAYAAYVFSSYQALASIGRLLAYFDVAEPANDQGGMREQVRNGVFSIEMEPLQ